MIRTLLAATASLALGLAVTAQAQPYGDHRGPMARGPMGGDPSTMSFITQAAQSDEFERQEGRLAEGRADRPAVRNFAGEMVSAHTQTTQSLKAAIRRAGMTPPPPPPLSGPQARMLDDLRRTRGRDFDRTYMRQQVQAHQQALGLMQSYAQTGRPGPIRDAARMTVPIVRHHLDMANAIQARLGG